MIHVVIGQSGSGKTTYVRQRWLHGATEVLYSYPVPVTRCGEVYLIGIYDDQRRELGTDKLPYNALPRIISTVDMLAGSELVMEGDRINNRRMFDHLVMRRYPFGLILCRCPLDVSMARLGAAGSTITRRFVQATATKSRNNFLAYSARAAYAEVVETA